MVSVVTMTDDIHDKACLTGIPDERLLMAELCQIDCWSGYRYSMVNSDDFRWLTQGKFRNPKGILMSPVTAGNQHQG